jgi:hypothetical protein
LRVPGVSFQDPPLHLWRIAIDYYQRV